MRKMHFSSLKTQILFFYILTATCIVIMISLVIGRVSTNKLTESALLGTDKDLTAIGEKFDVFFDYIESDALYMVYTRQSFKPAENHPRTPYENFIYINSIYNSLLDLVHTNPRFQSVTYYEDSQIFISDSLTKNHGIAPAHMSRVEQFRQSKEILHWLDVHQRPYDTFMNAEKSPYLISLLRKSFDTNGYFLGIMELNFSAESLASIYKSNHTADASFFIVNADGIICSSPDAALLGAAVNPADYGGLFLNPTTKNSKTAHDAGFLYVYKEYPRMGWKIVGVVSQKSITAHSRTLVTTIFLVGLAGILLSILVFAHISRHITGPLEKITSTVSLVATGDYTQHISVSSGDEIGILAERINAMVDSISSLMEDIQSENQQKREFELSYIQTQMSPHFLYNTLETVCGMIEIGDQEDAISVIGDISQFYRCVLTGGERMVTLERELSIVDGYLKIMSRRYPNAFTWKFDIEKKHLDYRIPKLTLQPIVENAVIHGCIPSRRFCQIAIIGRMEEQMLRLIITDNGVGMEPGKSQGMTQGESHKLGFGFSNTEKRLKLHLGESARLCIDSEAGHGVRVTLLLPVNEAKEEHA